MLQAPVLLATVLPAPVLSAQGLSPPLFYQQVPASSVFLLRVEFESSSSKKSEYRVEYRVAIAVVGSVFLDVIIISDITVILSRLDWTLKKFKLVP